MQICLFTFEKDLLTFTSVYDYIFMVLKKLFFIGLIAFFATVDLSAQTTGEGDSAYTPYRQSRWLAGLSGGILSSSSEQVNGENVFTNRYNFDINISYFLAKRWMAGLEFTIFRSTINELVERESETLTLGPIGRFYISPKGEGSVFFEAGVRHGQYWEKTTLNLLSGSKKHYQMLSGHEIGAILGIGYSHTLLDKIAFEMGMDYYFASQNGTIENTLDGTIETSDNQKIQFEFAVGFVVFLR